MGTTNEFCQCGECTQEIRHLSDCAVHNEPAMPKGKCNCSPNTYPQLTDTLDFKHERARATGALTCAALNMGVLAVAEMADAYAAHLSSPEDVGAVKRFTRYLRNSMYQTNY